MEQHLVSCPRKTVFDESEQISLRSEAMQKIQTILLPNALVQKIVLIGSSVKGSFGKYDPPGFRGSLYSDFDFIVFVDDAYEIPSALTPEPEGKPFSDITLNLAFRMPKFLRDTYDAEVFFIRETHANGVKIQKIGEDAGIPMTENSLHPHIVVYTAK